jgi:hypothetical protein
LLRIAHYFIDVLEVFSPVLQGGPQQSNEGENEDRGCQAELDISMAHKDFRA